MKAFGYLSSVEIVYGCGRAGEIGGYAAAYGKRALLVSRPETAKVAALFKQVKGSLEKAGVVVTHFTGVIPNPTTDSVTQGARMARESGAELVIGLGGGSAMDTAKAVAVETANGGTAWDYLFYKNAPSDKTLPILCIGTTAGSGSQTTPCAVITHTETQDKSAIWHKNIFPKVSIVDPDATMSMHVALTAQTGFDAFCHNFEAFISTGSNPMSDTLALDALARIVKYLPLAVADGSDREARSQMSWADTLGGLTITAAGVTLPHGLGMQIGGHCPHVSHGQALAAVYPAFTQYTVQHATEKFAAVGRIFDPALAGVPDAEAAEKCCDKIDAFLKQIGLWIGFKTLGVTQENLRQIANCGQVLGDYKNNPRIATIDDMYDLLMSGYER
ncbi:MAG: iron-containing alcohol dehydrogenase [Phycisphaerales bacterium]|nr:iron-containing alcohol dehydrogenase [Phycisphaerales bacterium]